MPVRSAADPAPATRGSRNPLAFVLLILLLLAAVSGATVFSPVVLHLGGFAYVSPACLQRLTLRSAFVSRLVRPGPRWSFHATNLQMGRSAVLGHVIITDPVSMHEFGWCTVLTPQ